MEFLRTTGGAPVDATHPALPKQAKDLVFVVRNEQPPLRRASSVDEDTLVMIEVLMSFHCKPPATYEP
jgi:hypothetical protein